MEIITILLLFLGLLLLLGSGKYLVDSSVALAKYFRIPTIIIGLTVVAFGTSAPELLVSLQAAVQGHPDMAIGNVIGSNLSNILLVLAITTIVFPLSVQKVSIWRDWPIMMGISLLFFVLMLDLELSRIEGGLLVSVLLLYLLFSVLQTKKENGKKKPEREEGKFPWWVSVLILIASIVGLAIGADLLVDNASIIAAHIGVSERVISISMVAVGTSLPELATSIIAALKKETEISLGNIIGSNIMNIVSVLGFTSLVTPIHTVKESVQVDIPWMLGASLLLFLFMLPIRKNEITRMEGFLMLSCYIIYIYFIFSN